jgi:hypothetical protein
MLGLRSRLALTFSWPHTDLGIPIELTLCKSFAGIALWKWRLYHRVERVVPACSGLLDDSAAGPGDAVEVR